MDDDDSDAEIMQALSKMMMLYGNKKDGAKLSAEDENFLSRMLEFARIAGIDPDEGLGKFDGSAVSVEPFPASAVERNLKKVGKALEKGEPAPERPLFFLSHVCSVESWMKPAIEAQIIPLLKRVVAAERKVRMESGRKEDTKRLSWSLYAQAEVCMHPSTHGMVDMNYFFDLLTKKDSSTLEKIISSKAIADELTALQANCNPQLLRIAQDHVVMEELTLLIESNQRIMLYTPNIINGTYLLDNAHNFGVLMSPIRIAYTLLHFARDFRAGPQFTALLGPYKARLLRRFQVLFEMKQGVGNENGIRDITYPILKAYGLTKEEHRTPSMMSRGHEMVAANMQEKTVYRKCLTCGKEERPKKPHMVCSACKWARYCDSKCSTSDWKRHKAECKAK